MTAHRPADRPVRLAAGSMAVVALLLLSGCVADESPAAGNGAAADLDAASASNETVIDDGSDLERSVSVGDQPHVHDYWNGLDEVLLMDDAVPTQETVRSLFGAMFRPAVSVFFGGGVPDPLVEMGSVSWRLPDESLVYEGTGQIDIEVDFSDLTQRPEAITLLYKPAGERDYIEYPEPLADGDMATIEIAYEQADIAHSKSSRWAFHARPVAGNNMAIMDGTLGVRVWAVKAFDIEEAPAHPDHWGNGTERMQLMDASWDWSYRRTGFQADETNMDFSFPEGMIVPPGTGKISLWLNYTVEETLVPVDYEVDMVYRSAADSRRQERIEPATAETGSKLFEIPVDLSMVDSPYASVSAWEFDLFAFPTQETLFATFFVNEASGTATIYALAHKDPAWIAD